MANSRCDWILVTSLTFDHESIFFQKIVYILKITGYILMQF